MKFLWAFITVMAALNHAVWADESTGCELKISKIYSTHFFVRGSLGGKDCEWMLDTGANFTVVDPRSEKEMGSLIGAAELAKRKLPPDAPMRWLPNLKVGTMEVCHEEPGVMIDLKDFREGAGINISGIIGCLALGKNCIEADYDAGVLRVTTDLPSVVKRMQVAKVKMTNLKPHLTIDLGGHPVSFLIDTGADGALCVAPKIFDAMVQQGVVLQDDSKHRVTVDGKAEEKTGHFTHGELLGVELKGVDVAPGWREDEPNLIGLRFLAQFHWILDLDGQHFYFEKRLHPLPLTQKDVYGVANFYRDGCMEIVSVKPGLLFAQAGLRTGDRITRFGPLARGEMNTPALKEVLFNKPGQTISIEFQHQGEKESITTTMQLSAEP